MATKTATRQQQDKTNYLPLILGGIALSAFAAFFLFSFNPIEGCVGVIEVRGELVSEDVSQTLFSDGMKGSATISGEIESAGKRSDVKSLLLLVDSPGGSVVASKEIYNALIALNKPSVSYINELAASGGYYVAAGTDYIVANPDSITGSIGARATFTDLSGLFEKIGYREESIKSGAMKDAGTPARALTPGERAVFETIVNESFSQFKSDVINGRGNRLDKTGFAQVLDARLLSGRQAEKIGLVDELGNRKAAIKKAAELGGIDSDDPKICELSQGESRRSLLGSVSSEIMRLLAGSSNTPKFTYQ